MQAVLLELLHGQERSRGPVSMRAGQHPPHDHLHALRSAQARGPHRAAAGAEGVAEDVVGDDVQLLLVLALDVGRPGQARQVADARPVHQARDLHGSGLGSATTSHHLELDRAQYRSELRSDPQILHCHGIQDRMEPGCIACVS